MPQRLLNPNATKTIEIAGTKYTIKPLVRQDHSRIIALWYDVTAHMQPDQSDDSDTAFRLQVAYNKKIQAEVDQDALATIMARAIVSIDHPDFTGNLAEFISRIENEDFWNLYHEIDFWTGLDEETANFSVSSPEQPSELAGKDAEMNVAEGKDLAGDTQE